jgi:predicted DNA-binding WGR domain protein
VASVPARASVPPEPAPATNAAAATPTGTRRFELVEGSSSKFWEISVAGAQHTVHFGRIGTAGQSKTKTFPDATVARADADKLVAEKLAKAYVAK